jgi:hypothetical protein
VNFRVGLIRNLWEELDPDIMKTVTESAMQRVAEGVYEYRPETSSSPSDRIATVILNEKDSVLVTAVRSAHQARAVIRATRELTDKPVRFVVNTAGRVPEDVLAAFEGVYTSADVIGYPSARRALSIVGDLTLYRGDRAIVIRQAPDGHVTVQLKAEQLKL